MRERFAWLVVVAVAIAGTYHYARRDKPPAPVPATMTFAEATKAGAVTLEATASSDPSVLNVIVNRRTSGLTTLVIPAGTVYAPAGQGYQQVIAAQTVRVTFASGNRSEVAQPVYCLDRFLELPIPALAYAPMLEDAGSTYVHGPLAKLAACMEQKHANVTRDMRQMAVWIVRHDLLSRSRDEAKEVFREGLQEEAQKRVAASLEKARAELIANGFSLEDADDAIAEYRETRLSGVLDELIAEEFSKDWSRVKQLLSDCGVAVEQSPFF